MVLIVSRGEKLPTPQDLIDTVRDLVASTGLTLILEPGRSMVATSSALVNTVSGCEGNALDSSCCRCPTEVCSMGAYPSAGT